MNLMTAISSAGNATRKFKQGHDLIVIAQIQPRSALPDEDSFQGWVRHAMNDAISLVYADGKEISVNDFAIAWTYFYVTEKGLRSPEYQAAVATFRTSLAKWLKISERQLPESKCHKLLITALARSVAYLSDYDYKRWRSDVVDRLGGDAHAVWDEELQRLSATDAEQQYREALDDATRSAKAVALPREQDPNVTLRIPQGVGFSGRNRITHIIEYDDTNREPGSPVIMYLRYQRGPVPDDFLEQWRQRMGAPIQWEDSL